MKGSMRWRVANDNGVEAVHGVSDFPLYGPVFLFSFLFFPFFPYPPNGLGLGGRFVTLEGVKELMF